jgi:hypothetical protein
MDERLGTPPGTADSVVVRFNLRPDEPDTSARLDDSGSWSGRAIALGVVALLVMILVLLLVIHGALVQSPT